MCVKLSRPLQNYMTLAYWFKNEPPGNFDSDFTKLTEKEWASRMASRFNPFKQLVISKTQIFEKISKWATCWFLRKKFSPSNWQCSYSCKNCKVCQTVVLGWFKLWINIRTYCQITYWAWQRQPVHCGKVWTKRHSGSLYTIKLFDRKTPGALQIALKPF